MDKKTLKKLELDKILDRLASYAAFSASRTLLEQLTPTADIGEAQRRQQETTEARDLIEEYNEAHIGGARDVRPHAGNAERGMMLLPDQLLDIKVTLQSALRLKKTIMGAPETRFPQLQYVAAAIVDGRPVVDAINRILDDNGEILDSASPTLGQVRRDLRVTHDRLHTKLQQIVASGSVTPYLQEALITQRAGRYVIPVKAEHKGRIKGIVHETSSSGATIYVEPMATVEINNQIRELESAEQDEIQRILHEISDFVAGYAQPIVATVDALAQLDAAFARAKFAGALNGWPPTLIPFDESRSPGSLIRLYNARHPLIPADEVVPIDVELSDDTFILIITGPNTGGKTVSLKTVGLLTLMAQCGLHIPAAADSVLTVFDSVYADIGDEQSIEQSLSTFSAHMTHIIRILDESQHHSLVLLDELGSGTDPTEGAAIARAIIEDMRQRSVTCFVATHYPELKLYAHNTAGVRNASMEFDIETLSPTYRLTIGLPGRSNALLIAERLGLHRSVLDRAQSYIGADDLAADNLLDEIHRSRDEIRERHDQLARTENDVRILRDRLQQRMDEIEQQRQNIIEGARSEAEAELAILSQEIKELRKQLRAVPPTYRVEAEDAQRQLEDIAAAVADVADLIDEPVQRASTPEEDAELEPVPEFEPVTPGDLAVGDLVFVASLNQEGEILSLDGDAEVQVGQFRLRIDPAELEYRSRRQSKKAHVAGGGSTAAAIKRPRPESPGLELHLRGLTLDDALPDLEAYLDQAYLSGLPWVRIVHGKGTGVLRRGVQQTLERSSLVKNFRSAEPADGGDGVTVVTFVPLN